MLDRTACFHSQVAAARDAVLAHRLLQPAVAIVLGSGLGDLAQHVEHATALDFSTIPYFCRTHANGHAGKLVLGYLSGLPVVLMQGRAHRYEGLTNLQVQFPVYCMHALGAHTLITTNAAGGLNPRFRTGDLMVIDGHLDFLWTRGAFPQSASAPTFDGCGKEPYDPSLTQRARAIARTQNTVLHQGTYLATLGPTYETRSEYRMFRWTGADAVGMSTVPEVVAAQKLKMRVLAFSVITNVASTDMPQPTAHSEVMEAGQAAGPKLMRIIRELLQDMAGQPD